MSELNNEVKKTLSKNGLFDPARGRKQRNETVAMFSAKLRKVERFTYTHLVILVALMVFSVNRFLGSTTTKDQILYLGIFILAMSSQVLIKLWYWVVNTKISVLKEIKQLRLEMAMAEKSKPSPDSLDVDTTLKGRVTGLHKWERTVWLIALIGVAFGVGSFSSPGRVVFPRRDFAGNQADEWHISGPGDISIYSRISLTRWRWDRSAMVITMPYDNARLESVTYSGTVNELQDGKIVSIPYSNRLLPHRKLTQGKYELELPEKFLYPDSNPLHRTIDVVWSLPLETLEVGEGEQDSEWGPYRVRLRGLIPVNSFVLKVVVEPDCGFEIVGGGTSTETIPFWSFRGDDTYKTVWGSCSLCIQKK